MSTYTSYRRADFQEREPQPENPIVESAQEMSETVEYGLRELIDFVIPELRQADTVRPAETGDLRPEAGQTMKTTPIPGTGQTGLPADVYQQQLVQEAYDTINRLHGSN